MRRDTAAPLFGMVPFVECVCWRLAAFCKLQIGHSWRLVKTMQKSDADILIMFVWFAKRRPNTNKKERPGSANVQVVFWGWPGRMSGASGFNNLGTKVSGKDHGRRIPWNNVFRFKSAHWASYQNELMENNEQDERKWEARWCPAEHYRNLIPLGPRGGLARPLATKKKTLKRGEVAIMTWHAMGESPGEFSLGVIWVSLFPFFHLFCIGVDLFSLPPWFYLFSMCVYFH